MVQLGQCAEQVSEVHAEGRRDILRNNAAEAWKAWHRLQENRHPLQTLVATRKAQVAASPRGHPAAGLGQVHAWIKRHKLTTVVAVRLDGRCLTVDSDAAAPEHAMQLAGWYVLETDVSPALRDTHTAHDRSKDLAHVAHDVRTMKTGLLDVRPIFVRQARRTRGPVFVCLLALQRSRELQRRLAAVLGTTQDAPHGVTVPDAFAALHRLCLLTSPLDETHSVTRLPRPDAPQTRILQALQVPLPHRGQCRQEHHSPRIATNR